MGESAGAVDAYIAGLPAGADRTELHRLHGIVGRCVPGVGQATSYGMPCYTYRGMPVAAVIVRRSHIAWYPYSGTVLAEVADRIGGYSHTAGTLRFTAAQPLPDDLVADLLSIRMRMIDERHALG